MMKPMALPCNVVPRARALLIVLAGVMLGLSGLTLPANAQDPFQGLDMTSDAFTKAEMTRAEIETAVATQPSGAPLDLSGKSLNGLDLSGIDLHGVVLRAARLNKTNFKGANLEGANLDAVWALEADLSSANLKSASLVGSQCMSAKLDGADLSQAKV